VAPASKVPASPIITQSQLATAGKIVFHSVRDGNGEIYVMAPDGTGQTNITSNPAADYSGSLSPDGKRVAFVS